MRASWLIGVLGAGTLTLCLLLLFAKRPGTTPPAPVSGAVPEAPAEAARPAPVAEAPPVAEPVAAGSQTGTNSADSDLNTADEKAEAVMAAKLEDLRPVAAKADAASVEKVIFELRIASPQLREEMLEMVSQSQNRALIPGLQELADQTEDPKEKGSLLETIEFLKLPTLTELLKKAEGAPKAQ